MFSLDVFVVKEVPTSSEVSEAHLLTFVILILHYFLPISKREITVDYFFYISSPCGYKGSNVNVIVACT